MEEDLAVKRLLVVGLLSEQRNRPNARSTPPITESPVGRVPSPTAREFVPIDGRIDQLTLNREHVT